MNSPRKSGTLAAIALVGCLSALLQSLNKATFKSGTFLLNGYWASFYSMSYSDGFRRRALIGSIIRALQPNGGSIVAVNILAGIVLIFLTAIYAIYFIQQSRKTNAWNYVFCAAFFFSALIRTYPPRSKRTHKGGQPGMACALVTIVMVFAPRVRAT